MERRGQDRDVGVPNSTINYNPPQIIQESPVKLPLAPIVSTPQDRRGYATFSNRRGTAIFSPTQTLDHHHHHRQQLNPPPQPQVLRDTTPDPDRDPDPTTPPTDGGISDSKTPKSPPPPPASTTNDAVSVRYRECLKNHAASMGGHVVDGCGEFMPGGDEGTVEALRCAACDCHRNFHRKEADGEAQPSNYYPNSGNNTTTASRAPLLHAQTPHQHHHHKHTHSYSQAFAPGPNPPAMVSFGGGAADESSSEDLNMFHSSGGGSHAEMQPSYSGSKKRFRTKFTHQQKERMQELAERLGWRIQKQDEEHVQRMCSETGVKRQVFKVWMHNNKQAMKKRSQS